MNSLRAKDRKATLELLQSDPMVQMAARVAHTFNIDPIIVLDDNGDDLLSMIRVACANVVSEDERKQNEESKRKSGGGRRGRRR